MIFGQVQGNVEAADKVDIRREAKLVGDITTARISIEDGALFKGSIDIRKPEPKPAGAPSPTTPATPSTPSASPVSAASGRNPGEPLNRRTTARAAAGKVSLHLQPKKAKPLRLRGLNPICLRTFRF